MLRVVKINVIQPFNKHIHCTLSVRKWFCVRGMCCCKMVTCSSLLLMMAYRHDDDDDDDDGGIQAY